MTVHHPAIVIIGAPRSGTNILRDVVCRLRGFGTWPCDEINPIWRHGNLDHPDDALPPALATDAVRSFVRVRFARLAAALSLDVVVEKTCANSLRVPFVDRILPEARYLFIVRRPEDAVPSAMQRWESSIDIAYSLRKLRFTPPSDAPHYVLGALRNRLARALRGGGRLPTWGPRPPEADSWRPDQSLAEMCVVQWRACVEASVSALRALDRSRVVATTYEDFTREPGAVLATARSRWSFEVEDADIQRAIRDVVDTSVGRGARRVEESVLEMISRRATPTYERAADWTLAS